MSERMCLSRSQLVVTGLKDQNPNHCSSCHTLPFPSQSLAEMTVTNAYLKLHNVKGVNKRIFRAAARLCVSQHVSMNGVLKFIAVS